MGAGGDRNVTGYADSSDGSDLSTNRVTTGRHHRQTPADRRPLVTDVGPFGLSVRDQALEADVQAGMAAVEEE
jgi:hypothetical protein